MAGKKGGFMCWLRKLFGRSKARDAPSVPVARAAQSQPPPVREYNEYGHYSQTPIVDRAAYHERNEEIAQKQVAGVRRGYGGGFVPAYTTRTAGPDPNAMVPRRGGGGYSHDDQTTMSSYGTNARLWNPEKMEKVGPPPESAWKGKLVGKQYDRREELTEDDEDMWARMAM